MTDYPTEPADILEAAADLLQSRGWQQRAFSDHADPRKATAFCAIGAIRTATGYSLAAVEYQNFGAVLYNVYRERYVYSMQASVALAAKVGGDVPAWNDRPDRTAEEVIDVMKHAAKDLRNRAALHE